MLPVHKFMDTFNGTLRLLVKHHYSFDNIWTTIKDCDDNFTEIGDLGRTRTVVLNTTLTICHVANFNKGVLTSE